MEGLKLDMKQTYFIKQFEDCKELEIIDTDKIIKVADLLDVLAKVAVRYGENSYLKFDAGHNNICVDIEKERV
jgi:hypothetical protein